MTPLGVFFYTKNKHNMEVILMSFDYFYGSESEQFSFYRIPKMLFKDKQFKNVSAEAKVLYGLMLDRMGLSQKNMWLDSENRVYIIYTIEDIIEDFGCARQKASKLLDELDKGCGLIERKRQGLGKPNIIYVKNFIYDAKVSSDDRSMKIENQEVWKSNFQKYENHTSRNMKDELQEVPKSYSNDNNINNNKYNNTNFNKTTTSYHITSDLQGMTELTQNFSVDDLMEEYACCRELVKTNIEYDIIREMYKREWLDEIVEIMVDVICTREPFVRINKQDYPVEMVRERFLKIDCSHIEYIYDSLKNNSSDVRNIRAFLITTIYRSYETADNWYRAKVNHDMAT